MRGLEDVPACACLLLVATSSELAALRAVSAEIGLGWRGRTDQQYGRYYRLDRGDRPLAVVVQTRMGSVGLEGSAVQAWRFQAATQAAMVVQVGMAFGTRPEVQKIGDVLVATSLLAYDQRDVVVREGRETVEYPRVVPLLPSRVVVARCAEHYEGWRKSNPNIEVRFGALLSGGSLISCAAHRDRIRDELEKRFPTPVIIGGEMEGAGLVGVGPGGDPRWGVIKGILDFADENRAEHLAQSRPIACMNAARFALGALLPTD